MADEGQLRAQHRPSHRAAAFSVPGAVAQAAPGTGSGRGQDGEPRRAGHSKRPLPRPGVPKTWDLGLSRGPSSSKLEPTQRSSQTLRAMVPPILQGRKLSLARGPQSFSLWWGWRGLLGWEWQLRMRPFPLVTGLKGTDTPGRTEARAQGRGGGETGPEVPGGQGSGLNLSFTRMDPSVASSLPPGQACPWWAQQSPSHPPSRSTGPLDLGTELALDTQDTPLRPIPTCLHPGWAVTQTSLTFTSKGAAPPLVSHRLEARPLTPPEEGEGRPGLQLRQAIPWARRAGGQPAAASSEVAQPLGRAGSGTGARLL